MGRFGLQGYLLAVGAPTPEIAVWTGDEYLQMALKYLGKAHPQIAVRTWEEDEETDTSE